MKTNDTQIKRGGDWRWPVLFILLFCLYVGYGYNDLLVMMRCAVQALTDLFAGNPLALYDQGRHIEVGGNYWTGAQTVGAGYVSLLPMMLWCLPMWALEQFAGVQTMQNIGCLLWYKGFLMVMLALCLQEFSKICKSLDIPQDRQRAAAFAFLSTATLLNTLVATHVYLWYLYLILAAVDNGLRGQKKRFLLWASAAVLYNPLALFFILPILVIKTKNIFSLAAQFLLCLLPWGGVTVVRAVVPALHSAHNVLSGELSGVLQASFTGAGGEVSLLAFLGGAVLLAAYLHEPEDASAGTIVTYCFFFSSALFVWAGGNPYWSVLMTPFMVLTICSQADAERRTLAWIAEGVLSAAMMALYFIRFPWVYGQNTVATMVLGLLVEPGSSDQVVVESFWYKVQAMPAMAACLGAVVLLGWGLLAYCCNPLWALPLPRNHKMLPSERRVLTGRFLCNGAICLLPAALYVLLGLLR